jgi:protein-tyrosine phosphatase
MKYVLFLCTANYYRSRFAEELFNGRATLCCLSWSARSRALAVERVPENGGPLSSYVIKGLEERGLSAVGSKRSPQQCSIQDLESADLIVALKETEHRPYLLERFAGWEDRVTYWHVHDIDVAVPTDALAFLDHQIETLIGELQKNEI